MARRAITDRHTARAEGRCRSGRGSGERGDTPNKKCGGRVTGLTTDGTGAPGERGRCGRAEGQACGRHTVSPLEQRAYRWHRRHARWVETASLQRRRSPANEPSGSLGDESAPSLWAGPARVRELSKECVLAAALQSIDSMNSALLRAGRGDAVRCVAPGGGSGGVQACCYAFAPPASGHAAPPVRGAASWAAGLLPGLSLFSPFAAAMETSTRVPEVREGAAKTLFFCSSWEMASLQWPDGAVASGCEPRMAVQRGQLIALL